MFSIIEGSVPKSEIYQANVGEECGPTLNYRGPNGKPKIVEIKFIAISMSVRRASNGIHRLTLGLFDKTKIVAEVDDNTLQQIQTVLQKKKVPTSESKKNGIPLGWMMSLAFAGILLLLIISGNDENSPAPVHAPVSALAKAEPLTVEESRASNLRFPGKRYSYCHHFPPLGCTHKNKPPPS